MIKILDIGVGSLPWLLREPREQRHVTNEPQEIREDVLYVGVDCNSRVFEGNIFHKNLFDCGHLIKGNLEFMVADGQRLPFPDDCFEKVILSDVFSIPAFDWCGCEPGCDCGCRLCDCHSNFWARDDYHEDVPDHERQDLCCGEFHRGVSLKEKKHIGKEALRVLSCNGFLIVTNHSTPENCFPIFSGFLNRLVVRKKIEEIQKKDAWGRTGLARDIVGCKEALYIKLFEGSLATDALDQF